MSSSKNPFERYFADLDKFQAQHGFLGHLLVRGVSGLDDDDADEDIDKNALTELQMQGMRFVLIDQARSDALEQMEDLILGDQAGDDMLMFNTSFSYQVLAAYEQLKKKLSRNKSKPATQLNLMFGFTYFLKQHDAWMHDHEAEWGGEKMICDLGKRWKKLLASNSNNDLGMDEPYTRPAVDSFLEDFKETVEDVDTCDDPPMEFNFE